MVGKVVRGKGVQHHGVTLIWPLTFPSDLEFKHLAGAIMQKP